MQTPSKPLLPGAEPPISLKQKELAIWHRTLLAIEDGALAESDGYLLADYCRAVAMLDRVAAAAAQAPLTIATTQGQSIAPEHKLFDQLSRRVSGLSLALGLAPASSPRRAVQPKTQLAANRNARAASAKEQSADKNRTAPRAAGLLFGRLHLEDPKH